MNKPKFGKKASGVFSDGFEFSAEAGTDDSEGLGWKVNQDVLEMASKKQVSCVLPVSSSATGLICKRVG